MYLIDDQFLHKNSYLRMTFDVRGATGTSSTFARPFYSRKFWIAPLSVLARASILKQLYVRCGRMFRHRSISLYRRTVSSLLIDKFQKRPISARRYDLLFAGEKVGSEHISVVLSKENQSIDLVIEKANVADPTSKTLVLGEAKGLQYNEHFCKLLSFKLMGAETCICVSVLRVRSQEDGNEPHVLFAFGSHYFGQERFSPTENEALGWSLGEAESFAYASLILDFGSLSHASSSELSAVSHSSRVFQAYLSSFVAQTSEKDSDHQLVESRLLQESAHPCLEGPYESRMLHKTVTRSSHEDQMELCIVLGADSFASAKVFFNYNSA